MARKARKTRGRDRVWLEGKDVHLAEEVRYVQRLAAERRARIVTIGPLLLFSTESGDAWLLDQADLPRPVHLEETAGLSQTDRVTTTRAGNAECPCE